METDVPVEPPATGLRESFSAANWLLRGAVLIYAAGLVVAIFTRNGSSIGEIALMEWGVSHARIFLAEKIVASLAFALALSLLLRPTSLVLAALAGLVFAEAFAGYRAGGYSFAEYTPFAEALRILTPLALIPLIISRSAFPSEAGRRAAAGWILRAGLAIVFFTHGLEAYGQAPVFIDLILGSARNLCGTSLSEPVAIKLLHLIAWVDFAVAVLVLARPSRPLLGWLFFWGLVTALSRPIALGFGSYPEVLLRASHFLAPIALWLLLFPPASSERRAQTNSSDGSTSDS